MLACRTGGQTLPESQLYPLEGWSGAGGAGEEDMRRETEDFIGSGPSKCQPLLLQPSSPLSEQSRYGYETMYKMSTFELEPCGGKWRLGEGVQDEREELSMDKGV